LRCARDRENGLHRGTQTRLEFFGFPTEPGDGFAVPRLTFECDATALSELVRYGDSGIAWSANLQVCGVVVPAPCVDRFLDVDLSRAEDVARGEPDVLAAVALDSDLVFVDVWVAGADARQLAWLASAWPRGDMA